MDQWGQTDPFETELRRELARGERLLWHDRAVVRAKRGSMAGLFFATLWTGFSLFWTGAAFVMTRLGDDAGFMKWAFPAFGIPFILIGLGMFAKPVLSRMAARRTAFGLTDRRVIRLYIGKGVMSESVPLGRISSITRHERGDGSGSLDLKLDGQSGGTAQDRMTGFELGELASIRDVERQLRDTRERDRRASSSTSSQT